MRLLCCWKRVFAMTTAFSWQNSVSLCPASFCTARPNLPFTPKYLLTFYFCIPIASDGKDFFSKMRLEAVKIEAYWGVSPRGWSCDVLTVPQDCAHRGLSCGRAPFPETLVSQLSALHPTRAPTSHRVSSGLPWGADMRAVRVSSGLIWGHCWRSPCPNKERIYFSVLWYFLQNQYVGFICFLSIPYITFNISGI